MNVRACDVQSCVLVRGTYAWCVGSPFDPRYNGPRHGGPPDGFTSLRIAQRQVPVSRHRFEVPASPLPVACCR